MMARDRVLNAINHHPVDRVPRDLGGLVSGISKIAYEKLLAYWKIEGLSINISDRVQQLARIDDSILIKLNIDTRHIRANPQNGKSTTDLTSEKFKDLYGIIYRRTGTVEIPTLYYEMVEFPLARAALNEVKNYKWPSPAPQWFSNLSNLAKTYWKDGYDVIADPLSGGILEQAVWLRGGKRFFLDLYEHSEIVEELLELSLINQLEIWEAYLEKIGEWVNIIVYGDDYGHQDRTMMDPNMWRTLVKPRVQVLIQSIKKAFPHMKIQLHSCGSIEPIITDLIEIGFDILNPVQPRAKNMDHSILKDKFGSQICFHGGFDIQNVLPLGNDSDVKKEVVRVLSTLAQDQTGYIFAMAHNILADVPPENIITAFKTLNEYNW
ncbi:MAG: uroporphyrinogen decarboxylase family protein [Candidatus Hodarchaeota archaeon]